MSALDIVLAVLDIVSGIGMIVLFLVQEGNDRGMGVVSGATTTEIGRASCRERV